eukprot:435866-Pleurochrysis_carterae.AAC.2
MFLLVILVLTIVERQHCKGACGGIMMLDQSMPIGRCFRFFGLRFVEASAASVAAAPVRWACEWTRSSRATKKPWVRSAGPARTQSLPTPSPSPRVGHAGRQLTSFHAFSSRRATFRTTASFSSSCTEHVEYTTVCTDGKAITCRRIASCTDASRATLAHSCPPAPPDPEQLASTKACVTRGYLCGSTVKKSTHSADACTAPARFSCARSVFARAKLFSNAWTTPFGPTIAASCVVLLPGAAQASMTCAASGGASASAGKHEARSCRISAPSVTSCCPCRFVPGGKTSSSFTTGSTDGSLMPCSCSDRRASATLMRSVFTRAYRGKRTRAAATDAASPSSANQAVSSSLRAQMARATACLLPPLTFFFATNMSYMSTLASHPMCSSA